MRKQEFWDLASFAGRSLFDLGSSMTSYFGSLMGVVFRAGAAKVQSDVDNGGEKGVTAADIGFILLFAVLIGLLLVMCCLFVCMGAKCLVITMSIIIVVVVFGAALVYETNYRHQSS